MDAHGCGDAGVVNLNASDFALWNKAPPLGVDFGNVVQHGEDLDELFQPDLSFGGCQAETVFVEWPSADVPELRDILQENAFPLAGNGLNRLAAWPRQRGSCWTLKIRTLVSTRKANFAPFGTIHARTSFPV